MVVSGAQGELRENRQTNMTPEQAVAYYEKSGMTRTDAVKAAAKLLGMSRNDLYALVMKK